MAFHCVSDPEGQKVLMEEQAMYEDFHLLTLPETYDNLVLKVSVLWLSQSWTRNLNYTLWLVLTVHQLRY